MQRGTMFPMVHAFDQEASRRTTSVKRSLKKSRRTGQVVVSGALVVAAHEDSAARVFEAISRQWQVGIKRLSRKARKAEISPPVLTTNLAFSRTLHTAQALSYDPPVAAREPNQAQCPPPSASRVMLMRPKELDRVFGHLPLEDILKCQQVCKRWKQTVIGSRYWREQLFFTPAKVHKHKPPKLNPLLTTINNTTSHYHEIYDQLRSTSKLLDVDYNIILSWKGRYCRPQPFFKRRSNPSFHCTSTNIEWQLLELSRFELCCLPRQHIFAGPEASLWKMYLCQPLPMQVHITVWEHDDAYLDDPRDVKSGVGSGHITEKFHPQSMDDSRDF